MLNRFDALISVSKCEQQQQLSIIIEFPSPIYRTGINEFLTILSRQQLSMFLGRKVKEEMSLLCSILIRSFCNNLVWKNASTAELFGLGQLFYIGPAWF